MGSTAGFSRTALALIAISGCGDNIKDPDAIEGRAIAGTVWHDENGNNIVDPGEAPLPGFTVYLDYNASETLDPGEPNTVTDADGKYAFLDLEEGNYEVRQVMQFGWRSVFESTRTTYIIGGNDAGELEYPFMASVGFYFEPEGAPDVFEICGGTLVSDRFVVTAAHCSQGVEADEAAVLLAPYDGAADGDGQVVRVVGIDIHPMFTGDVEDGFDIAVWQLSERLDLEARGLTTVGLLTEETADLAAAGKLATTIGFGVSNSPSSILQEVHVPVVADGDCAAAYPRAESLATQFCAGVPEGGIDSCQGDSGGPLLVRDPSGSQWMHAGITSWGDGCAEPGSPGVYGRTSALSGWAIDKMMESSRVYRVEVIDDPVFADFGNQPTVRPQVEPIDSRWQLTTVTVGNDGVVAANAPVAFNYGLIDEESGRSFPCTLDPDGPGPQTEIAETCAAGQNSIMHPGYADGAYRASLTFSAGGESVTRNPLVIAGSPSTDIANGALADTDQTDPDYNDTYYIDYYEITGASADKLTIVSLDTSSFGRFFVLYDADMRTAANGGGAIQVGTGTLEFFAEAGKRYLVGVSTQSIAETGSYTVTLTNNGTLTPFTLQ